MTFENWPYLCVFATLLLAGLGFPIPEDIPLLTGGYLSHMGYAHLPVMIVVGLVGVLSGDLILFGMGRRWGHRIVEHRVVRRLIKPDRLLMAEELFCRQGVKIIFAGRFLPGLRAMIFMASGVLKVPTWKFLTVNGLAALISVPTLVGLGYVFARSFQVLQRDVRTATHLLAGVILLAALIVIGIYILRRQKRIMASMQTKPPVNPESLPETPVACPLEYEDAPDDAPQRDETGSRETDQPEDMSREPAASASHR